METEFDTKQEVEVLEYKQSVEELNDKDFRFRNDFTLSQAAKWLGEDQNEQVLWKQIGSVGVGYINYPQKNLEVGLYFKHPNWRQDKLCRVNNDIDIKVFIHFISLMRDQENTLKQLETFNQ
jgi:hypothetical protein